MIENEYRVIGPPGCGKTTYLSSQVRARVERWQADTGLEPQQCQDVLVSSLTKAAAAEVAGRGLPLLPEQIGTLHAHALRSLGNPKLCVAQKQLREWNEAAKMDHWLSGGSAPRDEDGMDFGLGAYRGDALYNEYTINRCRMLPREEWAHDVEDFAKEFERWKFLNDYMDYTDLIENAFKQKVDPPGHPSTILVDECQDHDRLELRLLRYWASKVGKLIIVGDPDQNLYEWRGSDPGGFYESEIPDGQTKVLEQSYRVPRAIHAEAMLMISRSKERKPVIYHPRDEEGEVERVCWSPRRDVIECVREIDYLLQEPDSANVRPKVMVLFSCAYMAQQLTSALRSEGIPFWNPYSKERGNFNPLHPGKGTSTLDRILKFLKPRKDCHGDQAKLWTWGDFHEWADLCNATGWLRRGAKEELKRAAASRGNDEMTIDDIDSVLASPEILNELQDCKLEWLGRYIMEAKSGVYQFVLDIATKKGYNTLLDNPRVVVGTIHSVKGAEADHVILCPDLSSSGWDVYGSANVDSIHRLFYVGLTRAYRRLVLCAPSNPQAIYW